MSQLSRKAFFFYCFQQTRLHSARHRDELLGARTCTLEFTLFRVLDFNQIVEKYTREGD